jgi:D-glycero-alpha-D-manno-heptose 1-phosphate guanylyltransferase
MLDNNFQTLVLCGGKGERLQPLTINHQKCMLDVQGLPFLEYLDYQIHDLGIKKVVFCTGHKSEEIMKHFGTFNGYTYKYSCPLDFIGTGARIIKALPYINTDNIIVFNGDSFCNIETETFWRLYNKFIKSNYKICKLLVNKEGSLLSSFIGHKYEKDYFGAGIYFIKSDLIRTIEYNNKLSLENDIILNNFDKTMFVKLPENFFVVDFGIPENYELINNRENKFGKFFTDFNSRITDTKTNILP